MWYNGVMEYILLTIALAGLAIKGYCGKKTSLAVARIGDAFRFNAVRLVFCLVIGIVPVLAERASLAIDGRMAVVCLLAGVTNAGFLVCWVLAVRKIAMVTVDVALTLGSLLPAVLCLILFGEPISYGSLGGFALILLAALILAGYSRVQKGGFSLAAALLMVGAAVCDGLTAFCQQLYRQYCADGGAYADGATYSASVYNFYIYLFALITLLLVLAVWHFVGREERSREAAVRLKKATPYIFVMALCLFAVTYAQTLATTMYGMPAQVLYPALKGGCLVIVNFTGMIFFGEKMTRRSLVGSIIALAGMIMVNVL